MGRGDGARHPLITRSDALDLELELPLEQLQRHHRSLQRQWVRNPQRRSRSVRRPPSGTCCRPQQLAGMRRAAGRILSRTLSRILSRIYLESHRETAAASMRRAACNCSSCMERFDRGKLACRYVTSGPDSRMRTCIMSMRAPCRRKGKLRGAWRVWCSTARPYAAGGAWTRAFTYVTRSCHPSCSFTPRALT